jgi:DNA-binding CsgD family transcriptional regulator
VLYGRSRELDELDRLLADARAGEGRALLIVGEPGIGKTALLAATHERAEGMRVARASGVEAEVHLPFATLGEIAAPLLGGLDDLAEPQAAAIGAALALTPPPATPADRLATFAGFLGLVRSAAAEEPLLIVVDDAQWLDTPSAECLGYAARRLAGSRVALIVAARTGEGRPVLEGRIARELALSGLEHEDAMTLIRASHEELPGAVAEAVIELAVGNPLALRELPRVLTDEQRSGLAPVEPVPAPAGVLWDAFERRLRTLEPPAREAMVVAAASMDRKLSPVVSACRDLGLGDEAIEHAEVSGLLQLADNELAFEHPLLRGVAYQGASPAERRRAHRALAEHTADDAHAWHQAAAAIGPDAEVAAALDAAAGRATARGAHSAAADALERAAQMSDDDAERTRRLFTAGFAAGLGGDYERSAALLASVADVDEPIMRASIRHLLAMVRLVGGVGTALANHALLTEEGERILPTDPGMAATMHADAGVCAVVAGSCGLALRSAQRAAAVLPGEAPSVTRCQVLSMLGMGLALACRTAEATQALDEAGQLLDEVDPVSSAAQSIAFGLGARLGTGQEALLREEALSLVASARATGTRGLLPYDQLLAANAAYRLGDWEAAVSEAAEAVAVADSSGQRGPQSIALAILARVHAAVGDEEAARAEAERGMALAEGPGYGATVIWARAMLGFLELGLDRPDASIAELEQVERLAEVAELEDPTMVPWAPDLVEAYARAGHTDDAARVATVLRDRAERSGVPLALAFAARCEGLLQANSADEPFERAIEHHGQASSPFELARTLLAFGSSLHRARRRADARERLRAALELFEELGAAPWAERTRAELRAAGGIGRASAGDDLTDQELRVARAVVRGATNKQVATELFLSPKTIEFHLGHVYRKLGIHSRTQLAALAAEGRLEPGVRAGVD